MSCKNHKMNRYHIKLYKHNARVQWHNMSFWKKLKYWRLSYTEFEKGYVREQLMMRAWKYGNID